MRFVGGDGDAPQRIRRTRREEENVVVIVSVAAAVVGRDGMGWREREKKKM